MPSSSRPSPIVSTTGSLRSRSGPSRRSSASPPPNAKLSSAAPLLVISALPARRFGPAQNWQTHALEQFLSGDQPVPTAPVCPALLVNKIIPSLTGLSVQALRRLMRYAPASATLQTLLLATVQVHRHHCDASDDGDETNGTETSGSRVRRHYGYQLIALFLGAAREDLLTGPAASRLLELTLRCACAWSNSTERGSSPDIRNLLEAFYAKHMSGAERLRRLYLHPRANYCVQGLLYSANSGLVQRMLVDDALLEHLEASKRATHPEPRHDRSGVLCAVLRAVLRASVASDAALTHLVQRTIAAAEQWVGVGAVDTQKATQHNVRCIMQTLFPNDDEYEPTGTQKRTRAVATSPAAVEASERAAARGSVNGSLLLQLLVHHSSAVLHAFTQLDLPELLTIAKDMVACHALLAYLDAVDARQAERIQTRAQLYRCIPRVLELANSASGSRFLEKAARFMQQDLVWQRKVTEQLAPALTMLAGTHHGARCIRLFQVRLWLDYPQLWLSTRRKQASVKRVLSEILESDTNDGSLSRPSRDHRASTRASAKGHPLNAASAFLHSGSSDGCSLDQNAELERPQKKPSLLASLVVTLSFMPVWLDSIRCTLRERIRRVPQRNARCLQCNRFQARAFDPRTWHRSSRPFTEPVQQRWGARPSIRGSARHRIGGGSIRTSPVVSQPGASAGEPIQLGP
jgi:hypothetical protein